MHAVFDVLLIYFTRFNLVLLVSTITGTHHLTTDYDCFSGVWIDLIRYPGTAGCILNWFICRGLSISPFFVLYTEHTAVLARCTICFDLI